MPLLNEEEPRLWHVSHPDNEDEFLVFKTRQEVNHFFSRTGLNMETKQIFDEIERDRKKRRLLEKKVKG